MTKEEFDAWREAENYKCPMCPSEPLKARRSRCPVCNEWVSYTPDHPGHKYAFLEKGKVKWRKPIIRAGWSEFVRHMGSHAPQQIVSTLYETAD